MPVYDYRCHNCGDFEQWLQIRELDSLVHCSSCHQVANRLISAPNINLNTGRFPQQDPTPQVVKRRKPAPSPRLQTTEAGRPWMVSHSPTRY